MRDNVRPLSADTRWRLERLEKHVIGTEEKNWQDGLVVWRANLDKNFSQIRRLTHLWGGAIFAAIAASGLLNQGVAHVAGAFVKGLLGQ